MSSLLKPLTILLFSLTVVACGTGSNTGPGDGAAVTRNNMQPDSVQGWLYYSLEGDSVVPADQAGTAAWDLRMAYLLCCGKTQQIDVFLNSGTAGPGTTQGLMYGSRFDNLAKIPEGVTYRSDDTTKSNRIVPANVIGGDVMFAYDVNTHTINPSPDKVLLIKTSKGNIFKFQFTSIYKDAVSNPNLDTPLGFYHFRYQQAVNGEW